MKRCEPLGGALRLTFSLSCQQAKQRYWPTNNQVLCASSFIALIAIAEHNHAPREISMQSNTPHGSDLEAADDHHAVDAARKPILEKLHMPHLANKLTWLSPRALSTTVPQPTGSGFRIANPAPLGKQCAQQESDSVEHECTCTSMLLQALSTGAPSNDPIHACEVLTLSADAACLLHASKAAR